MTVQIIKGDCRDILGTLPEESVHCVVTSPPYFGLRDYGVAGQIGLEPTPDAFVAEMVAVFRDVRRVLRKDGTLWLNLGDSYAGSWSGNSMRPEGGTQRTGGPGMQPLDERYRPRNGATYGLKPKDLIGIPWRVAFALQQPCYTGKIKDERDRIWLAAMIDAEGCMFIHRRKIGQSNGQGYVRKNDTYGVGLEVANTSEAVVQRCMSIVGKGSICSQSPEQNGRRKQTIFRWNMRTNECRDIIREVYPYLVAKQQQARIILGCPPSGDMASAAHQALIGLHNGSSTDLDFPAPSSMFEQSWWLRQDLIWSKLNPMPESVTDRCTKAHEYIFLLSKSAKYHYDGDSIKEDSICKDPRRPYGSEGAWQMDGRPAEQRHGGKLRKGATKAELSPDRKRNGSDGNAESFRAIVDTRNKRSVWEIATAPYADAHFATFPPSLIEPCILAGCPVGGTVLDPFGGAGTTGMVADRLGRNAILIELNPEYAAMAERRIHADAGMFAQVL